MREFLTKNIEPLISVWCGVSILTSVVFGLMLLRLNGLFLDAYSLMAAIAVGIGGITLTLVMTGLFFNILDMRAFAKHTAMSLHKSRREGKLRAPQSTTCNPAS